MAKPVEIEVVLPRWRMTLGIWVLNLLAWLAWLGLLPKAKVWRWAEAVGEWIARGAHTRG